VAEVVTVAAGSRSGAAVKLRRFVRELCFLFFALCFLVDVLATGTITVVASFVSL
jgi:sodium/potassium/calcium exchanger 6